MCCVHELFCFSHHNYCLHAIISFLSFSMVLILVGTHTKVNMQISILAECNPSQMLVILGLHDKILVVPSPSL